MKRIIWSCWFQGRDQAPHLVRKCLDSWQSNNPGWDFRCLDAWSVEHHVPIRQYVDLERQSITAASLSDILRILLLNQYGGVWADATLHCNQPLDQWLPPLAHNGFFAFAAPGGDRPLSSWFLYGEAGHPLLQQWRSLTIEYWKGRSRSDDYFWFHHLFKQMCETDVAAAAAWSGVPKLSARPPHALQDGRRMYRPAATERAAIDWSTPVFKLTHRLDLQARVPGCLLDELLGPELPEPSGNAAGRPAPLGIPLGPIAPASVLPPR